MGCRPSSNYCRSYYSSRRCTLPLRPERWGRGVLRQLRSRTGGPGSLPRDDTINNCILKWSPRTARSLLHEERRRKEESAPFPGHRLTAAHLWHAVHVNSVLGEFHVLEYSCIKKPQHKTTDEDMDEEWVHPRLTEFKKSRKDSCSAPYTYPGRLHLRTPPEATPVALLRQATSAAQAAKSSRWRAAGGTEPPSTAPRY